MKKRLYFIVAVVIALVLPIIFGGIYFVDLYKEVSEKQSLASLDNKPEIFYSSSEIMTELEDVMIDDDNYEEANYYEFEISYTNAEKITQYYSLYLTNMSLSDTIDPLTFRWRLFMMDQNTAEYRQLASGNFANWTSNYLKISPSIKIGLNNIQRFRLYYYLVNDGNISNNYAGSTFKAKIEVE